MRKGAYPFPLAARIALRVDDGPIDTIGNHFEADWGGGYLKGQRIFEEVPPRAHRVRIECLDDARFDLNYILYAI